MLEHGTASSYTYGQCRCKDCTAANSAAVAAWRAKQPRKARGQAQAVDVGTRVAIDLIKNSTQVDEETKARFITELMANATTPVTPDSTPLTALPVQQEPAQPADSGSPDDPLADKWQQWATERKGLGIGAGNGTGRTLTSKTSAGGIFDQ